MPRYELTSPDGRTFIVEGPEGSTQEQALEQVKNQAAQAPASAPQTAPVPARNASPDSAMTRRLRGVAQTTVIPAAQVMSRPLAAFGQYVGKVAEVTGSQGAQRAAGYLQSLPQRTDQFAADVRQDAAAGAPDGFDYAGMEGQVIGTLPAAGLKVAQGVGKGAQFMNRLTQGGLQGGQMAPTNEGGAAQNVGIGAGVNVALPPVVGAVARVVKPQSSEAVRLLQKEGVKLTPGQMIGGAAKATEDKITSVPLTGDAIRYGQSNSLKDFNRAAVQRSMTPIGETLPKDAVGHEAIAFAKETLSRRYNSILPKVNANADSQFVADMVAIRQKAQNLPPEVYGEFAKVMRDEVGRHYTAGGKLSGEAMQKVNERLNEFINAAKANENVYARDAGKLFEEVSKSMRALVERRNPQYAPELQAIRKGYRSYKIAEDAASSQAATDGIFTPERYSMAVRAADKSKDKAASARGDAFNQDLANAGRKVIGSKVPDSGTAGRTLMAVLFGGAGVMNPGIVAGAAAGAVPYLPFGRGAVEALLTRRPQFANALSGGIRAGGTALAPAALPVGNALLNNGN